MAMVGMYVYIHVVAIVYAEPCNTYHRTGTQQSHRHRRRRQHEEGRHRRWCSSSGVDGGGTTIHDDDNNGVDGGRWFVQP